MKFLLIFFLVPLKLFAQDIAGVWTGTLYNDTTKQYLKYELAISEDNRKLTGYSYTIFLIDKAENIGVKSVKIKKSGDDILLEDDKLIYNNYKEPPAKGVRIYSDLQLTQNDSLMTLSGPWKTNKTKIYESITGTIFIQKTKQIKGTLIIAALENLGLAKSLSFMSYDNYSKSVAINTKPTAPEINKNAESRPEKNTSAANTSPPDYTQRAEIEPKKESVATGHPLNKTGLNDEKKQLSGGMVSSNDSALLPKNSGALSNKSKAPAAFGTNEKPASGIKNNNLALNNPSDNFKQKSLVQAGTEKAVQNRTQGKNTEVDKKKISSENQMPLNNNISQKKNDTASSSNNMTAGNKGDIQNKIDKKEGEVLPQNSAAKKLNETNEDFSTTSPVTKANQIASVKESNEQASTAKNVLKNQEAVGVKVVQEPKAAAEISSRKIETIKSVDIKNDSLLLTLYDNGEIDGDTVSVLMNGKVIMPMQGLTAKGISKTIYLTPEMGDSIELIMYAENLGSIPPNTGLLVVHDGDSIYEVRFSGDLKKNSAIILKRKRKEMNLK